MPAASQASSAGTCTRRAVGAAQALPPPSASRPGRPTKWLQLMSIDVGVAHHRRQGGATDHGSQGVKLSWRWSPRARPCQTRSESTGTCSAGVSRQRHRSQRLAGAVGRAPGRCSGRPVCRARRCGRAPDRRARPRGCVSNCTRAQPVPGDQAHRPRSRDIVGIGGTPVGAAVVPASGSSRWVPPTASRDRQPSGAGRPGSQPSGWRPASAGWALGTGLARRRACSAGARSGCALAPARAEVSETGHESAARAPVVERAEEELARVKRFEARSARRRGNERLAAAG